MLLKIWYESKNVIELVHHILLGCSQKNLLREPSEGGRQVTYTTRTIIENICFQMFEMEYKAWDV